jgi:indolepyruvate ferredoxin oxidoreductase alpha subunit
MNLKDIGSNKTMKKQKILLGDEALAMGAVDAGLSAGYAYPGTPSTEIMEFLQRYVKSKGHPIAKWCSNEKTAYESALGMSMAGKRTLVIMKHVGLNVAADPFINSALLKINGGLVVAVADDPGMHSSQNEQDSRYYADFAKIICFEPRDQQETYDMTLEAFKVSEEFNIPVMIRLVTRLAHSRAAVTLEKKQAENKLNQNFDKKEWTTIPGYARKLYANLLSKQALLLKYSHDSSFNLLTLNDSFKDFGVITTGLGENYFKDNIDALADKPSHLHISVYPIPDDKIRELAAHVKRILVIEEGYPYVERYLRGILPQPILINGQQDGTLPNIGELTPDIVRDALHIKKRERLTTQTPTLPKRPPRLCAGCPHIDAFLAINTALEKYNASIVTSDIGCYSLGVLEPFSTLDSLVCMGASIGMAKGASEAGVFPVIATIGDSTFLHSGITALIDAVVENTNMTVIILDNSTTAMTGGQPVQLSTEKVIDLIKGLGVTDEHLKIIIPLKNKHKENVDIIDREINYSGLSVIISKRECIKEIKKKNKGN